MEKYNPKAIESKWQEAWEKNLKLSTADNSSNKPKKYILDMFPYPSGEGLHTGHVESYTATDIICRYLRMKDYSVLHPQGWDAFGLPAENYAIKTKIHPSKTTKKAIATFKEQMKMMGFSYDWSREVNSSDPEYYKWTQWFFLLLYKNGLAYRNKGKVNWCDSCQTVLANEQAESGVCERCGKPVVQKELEQWYFSITKFIEPSEVLTKEGKSIKTAGLLDGLDKIDWPESTKAGQRNWIGKSEGAQFQMPIEGSNLKVEVFTTRLDTVFGMTFALIAPEHELVQKLKSRITNWKEVEKYIEQTKKKTDLQRQAEVKDKTGVELKGIKVINPFTKKSIPLFASDFVLAHYGTGAVMAVPGHDQRDYDFAQKFKLPIDEVIKSTNKKSSIEKEAYTEDGVLINSGEYNGLTSAEARKKLTAWLEKEKIGQGTVNYKLRDWLVSRQRYWGAPIPIIYCKKCGEIPVPEKDLPVLLPGDVDFNPTGESPLKYSKKFQDVKCPICGAKAKRESDTMDTFVCSSWYYFRYADPQNTQEFASKKMLQKWLPVDLYVGGAEHVVLHLLYSRFFTKVLHILGYIDFDEPFLKLRHQGIILAEDGRKMSKSLGNVVNPDKVVKEFGADSLRMFEMFMGPLEDAKPWNTKGIVGIKRFLENVYKLKDKKLYDCQGGDCKMKKSGLPQMLHKTIKKVTEDIEKLHFNTAISQMMIWVNFAGKFDEMPRGALENFLKLLAPFAPHLAEELWSELGHKESIFKQKWPEYNPALVQDEEIELVVQINGKVRDRIKVPSGIAEKEATELAKQSQKIQNLISGKEIKKVIFVKNRLINIVI